MTPQDVEHLLMALARGLLTRTLTDSGREKGLGAGDATSTRAPREQNSGSHVRTLERHVERSVEDCDRQFSRWLAEPARHADREAVAIDRAVSDALHEARAAGRDAGSEAARALQVALDRRRQRWTNSIQWYRRNVDERVALARKIFDLEVEGVVSGSDSTEQPMRGRVADDVGQYRARHEAGLAALAERVETWLAKADAEEGEAAARLAAELASDIARETAGARRAASGSQPASHLITPFQFEDLRDRYARDAIALYRPYPPVGRRIGRSRFGGAPDLPNGAPWPRDANGVALHFLAQVDLAELPPSTSLTARCGTLLFFARLDDEMLVVEQGGASVLFDEASAGTCAAPPPDLDAIETRSELLDGEAIRLLPAWPLQAVAIRSIPPPDAFHPNARSMIEYAEYRERYQAFREEQIFAATGMPRCAVGMWEPMPIVAGAAPDERVRASAEESGFPWVARVCELVATRLLKSGAAERDGQLRGALDRWRAESAMVPAATRIGPDQGRRFAALVDRVFAAEDAIRREARRPSRGESLRSALDLSIRRAVAESGRDEVLARALPKAVYAAAYGQHTPSNHHQMFGYVPSSQEPLAVGSPMSTFFQLRTDWGMGLVIGDAGELDFRARHELVRQGRWRSVEASYAGG